MKFKIGDKVDYHSVIGQEITSRNHTVLELYPTPNNFGRDCAMISNKSGVVACDALTLSEDSACSDCKLFDPYNGDNKERDNCGKWLCNNGSCPIDKSERKEK